MATPLRVAILGSTGSIGRQSLDVAARFPDRVEVVALAAYSSAEAVIEQARAFDVRYLAMGDIAAARSVATAHPDVAVGAGPEAVRDLAAHAGADLVLNALVGAAGLEATIAALDSGAILALANKESLVVGGDLVTSRAEPGSIIPVDSEHSAIYQCLLGEPAADVARIWLTASGGPFRGWDRGRLAHVTAEQALAHPTWTMGHKITIDSATLMNKGLEAIEAHHLFGTKLDDISIVVHPQSCIHSMVEFADGSVKAHLGATDMRIPIQYALSHPHRWEAPVTPVDFATLGSLDFEPPDLETFGCLRMALEAGRVGGTMPAAMNAANEIAVAAFLDRRCGFLDIERVVAAVMERHERESLESVGHIRAVDAWARAEAGSVL
ncbi:MAG: 1-deoxy-D-xylulose-5-phosphate reductoisomerase [Actinomycetota bacterium]|nr:1-deoxy-D-xylulose-5-phosphate reductoisomerase [Actinomycetota bacterium]